MFAITAVSWAVSRGAEKASEHFGPLQSTLPAKRGMETATSAGTAQNFQKRLWGHHIPKCPLFWRQVSVNDRYILARNYGGGLHCSVAVSILVELLTGCIS